MPYAQGFKDRMIQRMAGPEGISAGQLAKEVGVAQATLSRWLRDRRTLDTMGSTKSKDTPSKGRWTAQEKLRIVMEAARCSEEELGAFLRREGLHEAQLAEWRATVEEAARAALETRKRPVNTGDRRRIRDLERELNRKDKALAEVTALLALKKKVLELWGDEDDDTRTRRGT